MTTSVRRSALLLIAAVGSILAFHSAAVSALLQLETVKALAANGSEGAWPAGPMAEVGGKIYGFITAGATSLFQFDPATGTFERVWTLDGDVAAPSVADGGLVTAGDGNLYFVDQGKRAELGMVGASGWIGRVTAAGEMEPWRAFPEGPPGTLPINPYPGLGVGPDGAVYGVSMRQGGGAAIYRVGVGLDNTFSKVADFLTINGTPNPLTSGSDGWLYGTTAANFGPSQLFRVDPVGGTVEVLATLAAPEAVLPRGRLLEVPPLPGQDLAFVGVSERGGVNGTGYGSVFRVSMASGVATVTKLHDFVWGFGGSPDESNTPLAGLIADASGQLYGVTGGSPGWVYRIGPTGGFTLVQALGPGVASQAPLLLGSDGHFYGTTLINSAGPPPAAAAGSIFRLKFVVGHDLLVTLAGAGAGTITSADGSISCPGDCAEAYANGSTTTLTAVASAGSTFAGWSGDCTGTAPCVLTMNADHAVTATFAVAAAGRDLLVTAASSPPALTSPGSSYSVTDTTLNQGTLLANASSTRIYLSVDGIRNAGDVRLTGARAVPSLASGVASSGSTTVTIPASMAPGVYRQLTCADDTAANVETNETNNCLASAGTIEIRRPDLVETAVSSPPVAMAPGTSFTVTDTAQNVSAVTALASSTRYYFSTDDVRDNGDVLLTGTRTVAELSAGASSTGNKSVKVPAGIALGTYRLLACADGANKVKESNEANNCLAAAGTVVVAQPDLVTTQVTGLPASRLPGQKVTLTDTVVNQGAGPAVGSNSRYYLSLDAIWDASDLLLTGSRSVTALAPGASSVGAKSVTVPLATPLGLYYALTCADDTKKVVEGNEGNNCVASATTINIGP